MRRALPFALLAALALVGCGEKGAPPRDESVRCPALRRTQPPARRPVVLVVADTLRRDRLGAYGGPARTPYLDGFARRNVLFTAAMAQAPWTKPSMASLFTGLHPSQHGVLSHPRLRAGHPGTEASDVLGSHHVTLAERLRDAGYRTAAFVSNPWLKSRLGFAQGFDVWNDSFAANATPGHVVTRAALDWLEQRPGGGGPWFLYVHYMEPHQPYHPVPAEALEARRAEIEADTRPVTPAARQAIAQWARDPQGRRWVDRGVPPRLALLELVYDQGVERFDHSLGILFANLARSAEARDAIVIVTSDHGEALFQRGWSSHGHGLFAAETGIPLVARLPGVEADGPVRCPVGLLDLPATLCDLLGIDCPDDAGRSWLDPGPPGFVRAEGVIGRPGHRALRTKRWKLLYEPEGRPHQAAPDPDGAWALYDLAADPRERHDLLDGEEALDPEAAAAFEALRPVLSQNLSRHGPAPASVPLDEDTRERLEALGYVGGE